MKKQWNIYYLINFNRRSEEGGTCFGLFWVVVGRLDRLGSFCLVSRFISYGLNRSQIGLISKNDLNVNEAYSGAQL